MIFFWEHRIHHLAMTRADLSLLESCLGERAEIGNMVSLSMISGSVRFFLALHVEIVGEMVILRAFKKLLREQPKL